MRVAWVGSRWTADFVNFYLCEGRSCNFCSLMCRTKWSSGQFWHRAGYYLRLKLTVPVAGEWQWEPGTAFENWKPWWCRELNTRECWDFSWILSGAFYTHTKGPWWILIVVRWPLNQTEQLGFHSSHVRTLYVSKSPIWQQFIESLANLCVKATQRGSIKKLQTVYLS